MEVTSTSTLWKQSSSLTVSILLPTKSWGRRACSQVLPAAAEHTLSGEDLGPTPEYPSSHWEGGRGSGFLCALGLFPYVERACTA